jgi:hypothetical protein
MDLKPLIVVKSVTPLATKQAYKILKKFLSTNTEAISSSGLSLTTRQIMVNLPEDVVEKLTVVVSELKDAAKNGDESTETDFTTPSKKEQKKEKKSSKKRSLAEIDVKTEAKTDKKKKRSKKEEQ